MEGLRNPVCVCVCVLLAECERQGPRIAWLDGVDDARFWRRHGVKRLGDALGEDGAWMSGRALGDIFGDAADEPTGGDVTAGNRLALQLGSCEQAEAWRHARCAMDAMGCALSPELVYAREQLQLARLRRDGRARVQEVGWRRWRESDKQEVVQVWCDGAGLEECEELTPTELEDRAAACGVVGEAGLAPGELRAWARAQLQAARATRSEPPTLNQYIDGALGRETARELRALAHGPAVAKGHAAALVCLVNWAYEGYAPLKRQGRPAGADGLREQREQEAAAGWDGWQLGFGQKVH